MARTLRITALQENLPEFVPYFPLPTQQSPDLLMIIQIFFCQIILCCGSLTSPDELQTAISLEPLCSFSIFKGRQQQAQKPWRQI